MKKADISQTVIERVTSRFTHPTREEKGRKLEIEALEPRILFSGSPAPAPEPAPQDAAPAQEAPAPAEDASGNSGSDGGAATVAAPPAASESADVEGDASSGATAIALTQEEVSAVAEAATQRWIASGISEDQRAALAGASYQIADLGGSTIGSAAGNNITLDVDAAGNGWFVDGTPFADEEFSASGVALDGNGAGGIDLLSAILHEQGHLLGLDDSGGGLMSEVLGTGVRLSVADGLADGAVAFSLEGEHTLHAEPNVSPGEMAGMRLLHRSSAFTNFDNADDYDESNAGSVAPGSFDRVAYYVELVSGTDTKWVWVSMDAFSNDPAKVGVPGDGSGIIEDGTVVTNMTIESNHPGVTTGTGITGLLEFWNTNYGPNGGGQFGSNDGKYDWRDARAGNGSHGSMQVADITPGSEKMVFSITGSGIGIGNNTTGTGDPDWTFGPNSYNVRNIEVWVNEPAPDPAPAALVANVPELAGYTLVYKDEIKSAPFAPTVYTVDNSGAIPQGSFERVAYYMELDSVAFGTQWVAVSFDAAGFSDDATKIGVPKGQYFEQTISNMNVASNVAGVTTGMGIGTGNVEFWSSNYGGNPNSGLGSSGNIFDYDDSGGGTGNGHGSMQIHNYGTGETIFAYNRWGNNGQNGELGIGNQPTGQPDWTFANNSASYTVKNVYVLVGGPQTLNGTAANDTIELRVNDFGVTEYVINGGTPVALAENRPVVINGFDGDDTLTIDFTNGSPITNGLTFNGGQDAGGGDALVINGADGNVHEYMFADVVGPDGFDGEIDLDGEVITFTGLEPITNTGTAVDVIFNLPAGADVATLTDNGATLTLDAPTFEMTTFTKPTGSLTINGGGGTDSLDLGTISYDGTLVLDLETVTQSGVFSGVGSIVKNGTGTMTLSQANTLDGDITVAAGTAIVTNASGLGSAVGGTTVAGNATLTIDLVGSQTVAEDLIFNADGIGRATLRVDNPAGQVTTLSGDIEVNSTGANLVQFFSQGGAGGTIRYIGDISGDLNNSVWFLRSNRNHEVLGSVNLINGGDLAITDGARVEIGAAGKSYDWDNTNVAFGTLVTNLDDLLPSTTNLNLGQGNGTLPGNIDLNGTNQTVNNLTATSNNATANLVTIDTGNTLTVNGNFIVGRTGLNQTTNLTATGGGALVVNGNQVRIGEDNDNQNSTENRVTVDLTGLGSFTTDVTEFLVGSRDPGSQDGSRIRANLLLSNTANTITSDLILVDDSGNQNTSPSGMTLGAGSNVINADDIRIGLGKGNGRVEFGGAAGTVTIRGAAGGSSAANIVVGQNTVVNTGATTTGLLDLDGHDADIIADTVTIANRTRSGNGVSGTFNVGSAGTTVSINTLIIADRTNGGTATGTYNQSGGSLTVGTGTQDLIVGRNGTNVGGDAIGNLVVSGATSVTIDVADLLLGTNGSYSASSANTDADGTLDLSGASSVVIDANNVVVGRGGTNTAFGYGDLILSATGINTITATNITVGDSNGTGNTGDTSTLQLGGASNTINANTILIGSRKSLGEFNIDAGGSLTVRAQNGSGAADLLVGRNATNTGTTSRGTFDLSGATNFDAVLDQFYVGVKGDNNNGFTVGVATLATDNDITANEIKVGRSGNNGGTGNELHFGSGTNDVITPVFTVGEWKTQGAVVDVAAGGTVNLGDSANRVELTIGLKNTGTGAITAGEVDFSAGTSNIFASNINIARESNTGSSGSPVGTLTLGDGTLDVTGNISEVNNDQGTSSLTVVGDQSFTIGGFIDVDTFTIGLDGRDGNVTYTGGPANIGDGDGTLDIARSNVAGQSNTSSLDLSATTGVDIDVTQVRIGTLPSAANPGSGAVGTLTLSTAGANSVTAGTVILGDSPGSGNTSGTSTIELGGATNDFAVNQFTIGNNKSRGAVTSDAGGSFTLTGTGGAGTGTLDIARRTVNTGANGTGLLDLSDASSVDIDVNTIRVGTITSGGAVGNSVGTWNFSDTGANVVTANSILVADSSAVGNTDGPASTINLGQDNTINVNTFDIGGRKSRGEVNIDAGGTLTLQGQGGAGTEADVFVGNNFANNTGTNNDGVFDMTGGTLNATLDQLTVGRYVGTTGGGSGNGEFTMDAGYVTANSVLLASSAGSNAGNTDGILNLNGGILDLQNGSIDDGGGTAVFNFNDATLRDVDAFGFNLDHDNGTGLLQIGPDATIDDMTVNGNYTGAADGILEIGLDGENGAGAAGGHDQLIVNGVVTLNNLTLDLNTAAAFAVTPGSTFVLIDNDGTDAVVGEFAGLAEGTIVSLAIPNPGTPPPAEVPGELFQISYIGGTGNDVVLTGLGVSATTNIWLDASGNLHIEDIEGADTDDNLTIRVEGTEVVVIDPDNALGTLIVGATQTAVGEVRIDTSLFGGDVIVETFGGEDVINLGSLGDSVIPGGLIVDGGDDFDLVQILRGSSTTLTTDSNIDIDAEMVKIDFDAAVSVVGDGTIDITATGGGAEDFIGIQLKRASLSSEDGAITLVGEGGSVGNHNDGVQINVGSTITTAGGSVSISGTGTGTSGPNDGVSLVGGSDVTVGGAGTITIEGASSGVNDSNGVLLFSKTEVTTAGGDISVAGVSGGTGARNSGIYTNGATVAAGGAGSISLDGEGGGTGSHGKGLRLTASSFVASGTGDITLAGTGGPGTRSNVGVEVGVRTSLATGSGDVTVTGEGGGTASQNTGVAFLSGSSVDSGGGITVAGTGGDGTSNNDGVSLISATLEAAGDISVTGEGAGGGNYNRGIDSTRSSIGGAEVTLTGTGTQSGGTSARFGDGVYLNRGGASAAGTLTIAATGGTGSSNNRGFYASGVTLGGTLAVTGTADAGTTGRGNSGVYILNSVLGAGTVEGTAGGGTGSFGAHMNNITGGLAPGDVTGNATDAEDELVGNFFNVLPALVLAAGAERASRKRKADLLSGLIAKLGGSRASEDEMEVYREEDGHIGLDATVVAPEALASAGVEVPEAPEGGRVVLLLTGGDVDPATGFFAVVDGGGELVGTAGLEAEGVTVGGVLGLAAEVGAWSGRGGSCHPVATGGFSDAFGLEG